ncbi:hypothetical protein JDV02_009254 [Purpureocillium takamizusanense]|uniref:Arylsulfotransferase n=1 Tax=Purpureocillium takamizusanense TaxID=2060973 RepID=A0A9Q8QS17_9HYPO|nr:uncharacterized protein JDV02_009254 [Purpureocillium takamizusanense]UNI23437.1 hypothetical protein JDV02_009254 [Purpureocillium takamizusanense]
MQDLITTLNLLAGTLFLVWITARTVDVRNGGASDRPYFESSTAYDWGAYGIRPQQIYQTFPQRSPKPNLVLQKEYCDPGFVFLNKRADHHGDAPFMIFDNGANLVWMPESQWHGISATDVTVQQYNGRNYIVFLQLDSSSNRGAERYILLDESYQVFMEVRPVGHFSGSLRGLRLTDNGSAIISYTNRTRSDMTHSSSLTEERYESTFQEIGLESGILLFQWRSASTVASINSVDKSSSGDYLVAGSFSGNNAVVCVSHKNGRILWQLGGSESSFKDTSGGVAVRFSGRHHANYLEDDKRLVILDHGATNFVRSTSNLPNSQVLEVHLDLERMIASASKAYPTTTDISSPSSIQFLHSRNTLLGFGDKASFKEVAEGDAVCEIHFAPRKMQTLHQIPGVAALTERQHYQISKYKWVGKPNTLPQVAVDPEEKALYVSWNGATTIDAWVLQSGRKGDSDTWFDLVRVPKKQFETKIPIPRHSEDILRVVALDHEWKVAAYSRTVSKHTKTTLASHRPERIPSWVVTSLSVGFFGVYAYRRFSKSRYTRRSEFVTEKGARP